MERFKKAKVDTKRGAWLNNTPQGQGKKFLYLLGQSSVFTAYSVRSSGGTEPRGWKYIENHNLVNV